MNWFSLIIAISAGLATVQILSHLIFLYLDTTLKGTDRMEMESFYPLAIVSGLIERFILPITVVIIATIYFWK